PCTTKQQHKIEDWLDGDPAHVARLQQIATELGNDALLTETGKQEVRSEMLRLIDLQEEPGRAKLEGNRKKFAYDSGSASNGWWLKVAAMLVVIITASVIGFYNHNAPPSEEITLQQYNVPDGKRATLQLADGSTVHLNGGSTLYYPEQFTQHKREVRLQGEAFFSVTSNKERPFIVHAGNTVTKVLGTSFNIRAYGDEKKVRVAVAEGKVRVASAPKETNMKQHSLRATHITRNQWARYSVSGQFMDRGSGNISELIAWKEGRLVFFDNSLAQIARRLEHWYDVDVTVAD